ncbi:uncharacterized protein METZ01_LOCUS238843 [marine metagenome]|uniref:Uncharacterized protein n=1 Tax=marine metagenome TaxID=408172 RepID=A0A382HFP3_9ZZZZ
MGYSQLKLPSLQRLKEITKKVQHRGKKSGRIYSTVISLKQITKQEFITGRHKNLVIPYEEGGKIKTIIADYKNGQYIKVIPQGRGKSKTISLKVNGATYDYWKKKKGW